MKLCSAVQMRGFDAQTIDSGTAGTVLMGRAGQQVCDAVVRLLGEVAGAEITVVCGGGNNGGDGFVVARLLRDLQARVQVLLLVAPGTITGDAKVYFDQMAEIPCTQIDSVGAAEEVTLGCDLIVDSLLGTGLTRDVTGRFAVMIEKMNGSGRPVVAVDIPSGLDADTGHVLGCAVRATLTVTLQLQKQGMVQGQGPDYVGQVQVGDIGISTQLPAGEVLPVLLSPSPMAKLFPPRQREGHKGRFGHVLVVAGSVGMTGAAVLSGLGCLRSGAGLVSLCVPRGLNSILETHLIEAMTIPVGEVAAICLENRDFGRIMAVVQGKGAIVLGPGLGLAETTGQLLNQLVAVLEMPLVIDADGLNLLSVASLESLRGREVVLTPHPGEMARLTGLSVADVQADRLTVALALAKKTGAVVVLKGAATIIAGPGGEVAINSTGNSGMGAGGMGDVLSGVIATFLARGLSGFDAACLGVYSHGRAGDILVESGMPLGYLASELAEALPDVWHEFFAMA